MKRKIVFIKDDWGRGYINSNGNVGYWEMNLIWKSLKSSPDITHKIYFIK
jgi:hypothetical protein